MQVSAQPVLQPELQFRPAQLALPGTSMMVSKQLAHNAMLQLVLSVQGQPHTVLFALILLTKHLIVCAK